MNNKRTVLIVGSRNWGDKAAIHNLIDTLSPDEVRIISGCARGVDTIAEDYAKEKGFEFVGYPADWDTHGKSAGMIRNAVMVKEAATIYIFWDGKSRGTLGTKNKIKATNKLAFEYVGGKWTRFNPPMDI